MNDETNTPILVSIVIPAYKQAEFVGEAIRSALEQTYSWVEVVVVDDASPDHTSEVVRQFDDPRVRLIEHHRNLGLSSARNTGMSASRGQIIALLDADDLFDPGKVKAHVDFLDRRPDIGVTYNARFELNHSSTTIREIWRPPLTVGLVELLLGFPFAPSDMVMRREWAFAVGLFDPSMGSAEDTDFPCRLALAGCKFAGIDRALNYRRYHSGRKRQRLAGRLDDVMRAQEAVFDDPRCPAEVLAIHSTAIKHHLMVIVSLALIQQETDLGTTSVRQLVRMDPSVLTGSPCELVDFLLAECIADESRSHEQLLGEVLAQLPPELRWLSGQLERAVARGYLLRGARAVMWGRPDDGAAHLARAAELRADIDEPLIQLLTSHVLNYDNEFGAVATQAVLENLTLHLEGVGYKRSAQQLQASYSFNRALRSYRASSYADVPSRIMQAISRDPRYLLNRGALSMLVHSLTNGQPQASTV